MTVCATVTVPPTKFILSRTLTSGANLRIELKPIVSVGDPLTPYIWVSSSDPDRIEERVRMDSDVRGVETIDRINGGALLETEWSVDDNTLMDMLHASNGSCLSAIGTGDGWELTLRFPLRERLAECYQECSQCDVELSIRSIYDSGWVTDQGIESVLTLPQREALLCALDGGYFEVPRQITLQELADQLGISDTAASQRLRRGTEKLLVEFVGGETIYP